MLIWVNQLHARNNAKNFTVANCDRFAQSKRRAFILIIIVISLHRMDL